MEGQKKEEDVTPSEDKKENKQVEQSTPSIPAEKATPQLPKAEIIQKEETPKPKEEPKLSSSFSIVNPEPAPQPQKMENLTLQPEKEPSIITPLVLAPIQPVPPPAKTEPAIVLTQTQINPTPEAKNTDDQKPIISKTPEPKKVISK